MKKPQKEQKKKSPVLFLVFSAVFVSFLLSFFLGHNGILRLRALQNEYGTMMMDNHRLAIENRHLMEEISRLKSDPAEIEKIAREDLNLVSPNDLVLIVPQSE